MMCVAYNSQPSLQVQKAELAFKLEMQKGHPASEQPFHVDG